MPFSNNNRLTRGEVLSRYFPQYHPVAASQTGLSGGAASLSIILTGWYCVVITTLMRRNRISYANIMR